MYTVTLFTILKSTIAIYTHVLQIDSNCIEQFCKISPRGVCDKCIFYKACFSPICKQKTARAILLRDERAST